jgi:hypothetical protein
VNASIEEVDQAQGLKLNGAQLMTIPGVDLASLPAAKRAEALQKLNAQPCTCGCDLTVAKCRVDDPSCGVSLPLARQIVARSPASRDRASRRRRGDRRMAVSIAAFAQTPPPAPAGYVGSAACQSATRRSTRAGRRRAWPTSSAIRRASRRDHSRSDKPDPLVTFKKRRHRVRLRQQVEAAVLHEGRRRLLPARRAVGRHAQAVAAYLVAEHRLVGAALSRRQHEAADRTAVRRLPLGELRRPDEAGHRVERRLREVPRPGQRARRRPVRANIVNPARARFRARERHVHPVPLAGPAADQPDRGPLLRLAGRLPQSA